jgi:signal peptidase I
MPLTQHTLPVIECKSYIDWPHWDYRRVKGFGNVKLNDIVVFNYPAGDTICTELPYQTEYYRLAYDYGQMLYTEKYGNPDFSTMSDTLIYDLYNKVYAMGSAYLRENGQSLKMGSISTRPTDRRENYVKRCVGLPGQTLQIKDHIVYLDGIANKEPDNVQYSYYVKLKQSIPEEVMQEYGISTEQLRDLNQFGTMPLTQAAKKGLESRTDIVESIRLNTDAPVGEVYPRNANTGWTRDNYGPVWIPAKGKSIKLNMQNIAVYERPIRAYEGNELKVENGKIFINGKEADEYTFKLDYYWMMGDNRHNSADSRYWGFVPEDHIVGKPIFVWWSSDPDRSGFGGVRWNRLFKWVDKIK